MRTSIIAGFGRRQLGHRILLSLDDVDDLMLGCGLPGDEQGFNDGFNMGRVIAVLLGADKLPGTTITRYCSSSLQTTRMAMHAIRVGEGDVFSLPRGHGRLRVRSQNNAEKARLARVGMTIDDITEASGSSMHSDEAPSFCADAPWGLEGSDWHR